MWCRHDVTGINEYLTFALLVYLMIPFKYSLKVLYKSRCFPQAHVYRNKPQWVFFLDTVYAVCLAGCMHVFFIYVL